MDRGAGGGCLEGLLLGKPGDPGRASVTTRLFVTAVRWGLRSGAPGPALPPRSGQWKSAPQRFTRWAQAGVWARVCEALPPERDNESLLLDSTIVRAPQSAAPGNGGAGSRRWGVPEAG